VTFVQRVPIDAFLRLHGEIDLALDPFPFGGGTTTCDALWMGVPVVTLRGKTGVGRGGASLLTHVGLEELVAESHEAYVDAAARLAGDRDRLHALRAGLRTRMRQSVLMDAPRFARRMEAAYRDMWNGWCADHLPRRS
jgi:predicted O-linked N-acetylglucosamine transferase (SPINDLY family)